MSGRWVLSAMLVGCLAMAGLFYVALKKAPEIKNSVTDQMQVEFREFAHSVQATDHLKVADNGGESYFVDTQAPWKLEIQDKVLVITAPQPEGEKTHKLLDPGLFPSAKTAVQDFVWKWVDYKFKNRKDWQLQVRFLNEPEAK